MDKDIKIHVDAGDAPFTNYSFVTEGSLSCVEVTTCPRYKKELQIQVRGNSLTLTLDQAKELAVLLSPAIQVMEKEPS